MRAPHQLSFFLPQSMSLLCELPSCRFLCKSLRTQTGFASSVSERCCATPYGQNFAAASEHTNKYIIKRFAAQYIQCLMRAVMWLLRMEFYGYEKVFTERSTRHVQAVTIGRQQNLMDGWFKHIYMRSNGLCLNGHTKISLSLTTSFFLSVCLLFYGILLIR